MAIVLVLVGFLLAGCANTASVVKRSDDPSPLASVVQQLSAQVTDLTARQTAYEARLVSLDKHVAFKAHFSASTLHVPGNAAYKFDSLIFNDGDAYNPVLGVFTAPYDGMYIFSAQLFAHANEILLADLMVNGAIVSRWALRTERLASGEREQSSITTVTVKLSEGDTVWVQQSISTPMDIFGSVHSFFTGALLYAY